MCNSVSGNLLELQLDMAFLLKKAENAAKAAEVDSTGLGKQVILESHSTSEFEGVWTFVHHCVVQYWFW